MTAICTRWRGKSYTICSLHRLIIFNSGEVGLGAFRQPRANVKSPLIAIRGSA